MRTHGQIAILPEDAVHTGDVHAENVQVATADGRGRLLRAHGFCVDPLQGGFTLWNQQRGSQVQLTAELLNTSAGKPDAPVRDSCTFVGGLDDRNWKAGGGTIHVTALRTGEIQTNGGITLATPDLISGGVFVITGTTVDQVDSNGPVATYEQNDMVLDNLGTIGT